MSAGVAGAVKPTLPVSIQCATVSSSGNVYQAQCVITALVQPLPEKIQLQPFDVPGVKLTQSQPPAGNGIGQWILTFEFNEHKPISIPFELRYPGGVVMGVGAAYDPFTPAVSNKTVLIPGVVVKGKDGSSVREFPSK